MFFRRAQTEESREEAWVRLAAQLDLEEVDAGRHKLDRLLDLSETPLQSRVYGTRRTGEVEVYAFDRLEEAYPGGPPRLMLCCLLVANQAVAAGPLRVTRRLREQLSKFQAAATQGSLVESGDADFDARVTVVAREPEVVGALLTPEVRGAIDRLLDRGEHAPTLFLSEQQLLASIAAEHVELGALEYLITDVMSVYAAMLAAEAGIS